MTNLKHDLSQQKTEIRDKLLRSAEITRRVAEDHEQTELITKMAEMIIQSLRNGGKVVFLGNGGSAADAQHLAAELVGRFERERPAIPAIALTTNTSILTAIANDYGYEQVFVRQVEALVHREDVVVGISTSGGSANVLRALELARNKGAYCLGLTGHRGGPMVELCDLCLCVESDNAARVQENHIAVGHVLCGIIEAEMNRSDETAQLSV